MRDLHNRISTVIVLNAAARANGAYNGAVVDRQLSGKLSQSLEFVQNIGTKTDGTLTASLEESDTGAFGGEQNNVAADAGSNNVVSVMAILSHLGHNAAV